MVETKIEKNIYEDISKRTAGEVYIGVVGPCRTGKSAFIRKFAEEMLIPNVGNEYDLKRITDQIPQSGSGKTVTTTEPKFIPDTPVSVSFDEMSKLKVKLIDCVGYTVSNASGIYEDDKERLIVTPWSAEPKPFSVAAEEGTYRVIKDHSTIVIAVLCDGSICDIEREDYIPAEERIIEDIKKLGKPFVVVLNSAHPENEETKRLAYSLEEKYGVPLALVNAEQLETFDFEMIMRDILGEFPVSEIFYELDDWFCGTDKETALYSLVVDSIKKSSDRFVKMSDFSMPERAFEGNSVFTSSNAENIEYGSGKARLGLHIDKIYFYKMLGEYTGKEINCDADILNVCAELGEYSQKYNEISDALESAKEQGYGIVIPKTEVYTLDEPEIIKQSGGYGVKLKVSAPSYHIIKTEIQTELNPVVGTVQQSEDLAQYLNLKRSEETDCESIWDTNMFGKSLRELAEEGILEKLSNMPQESREKMSDTLSKIINEGSGGLICIIL